MFFFPKAKWALPSLICAVGTWISCSTVGFFGLYFRNPNIGRTKCGFPSTSFGCISICGHPWMKLGPPLIMSLK